MGNPILPHTAMLCSMFAAVYTVISPGSTTLLASIAGRLISEIIVDHDRLPIAAGTSCSLFVKKLSKDATEEQIKQAFESNGAIHKLFATISH